MNCRRGVGSPRTGNIQFCSCPGPLCACPPPQRSVAGRVTSGKCKRDKAQRAPRAFCPHRPPPLLVLPPHFSPRLVPGFTSFRSSPPSSHFGAKADSLPCVALLARLTTASSRSIGKGGGLSSTGDPGPQWTLRHAGPAGPSATFPLKPAPEPRPPCFPAPSGRSLAGACDHG